MNGCNMHRPPYFLTAYEIAVKWEFRGTEEEWLHSLTAHGVAVKNGYTGTEEEWLHSLTAHGIAVKNGYEGTEEEWLASLSAYGIAKANGFEGSEEDWLNSLTAFSMAQEAGYAGTVEDWLADLIDPVPNLQIGKVVTLEAGSNATASITGDKRKPLLNLGIPQGTSAENAMSSNGGTMKGDMNMDGHTIQNLPLPTANGQAVPKEYVDTRLKKDGSEAMTGDLNMDGHTIKNLPTPTAKGQAVPKEYVDQRLKKDGSEAMTGDMNMDGHTIKNLTTPTADGQAANKAYVDSRHFLKTVSLPASGWSGSAPYTQTIAVAGILSTDTPHWGVVYSADNAVAQKSAFAVVDDLDTANGSVTFTCFEEKPEIDLTIQMEVNR